MKSFMNEEAVFAQKVSDEELESINGGKGGQNNSTNYYCNAQWFRRIYEGGFANCAATVNDGSWCWSNDACWDLSIVYKGMTDCRKAWR